MSPVLACAYRLSSGLCVRIGTATISRGSIRQCGIDYDSCKRHYEA